MVMNRFLVAPTRKLPPCRREGSEVSRGLRPGSFEQVKMTELMLAQVLDFDELHHLPADTTRVVAGVGEDWPQFNVFHRQQDAEHDSGEPC